MKYEVLYIFPVDALDSVIIVQATPHWLEETLGRKKRIVRYYGSGTTWRKGKDGPRCAGFTSEWLHGLWSRELNRRAAAGKAAGGKETPYRPT